MVRWSDGSFSLLIGNELFEVATVDIQNAHQYLLLSHQAEGLFQTQAKFSKSVSFRPHSTQSAIHKKLTKVMYVLPRSSLFASASEPLTNKSHIAPQNIESWTRPRTLLQQRTRKSSKRKQRDLIMRNTRPRDGSRRRRGVHTSHSFWMLRD